MASISFSRDGLRNCLTVLACMDWHGITGIIFEPLIFSLMPGPASSKEECRLCKIVFSGDPSLNPASSKKTP